jgi:hypothetical protein
MIGMKTMKRAMAIFAMVINVLMAGGDIAPVEPVVPEVVESESWNYYASVYLYAAAMGGETAGGQNFDMSFSDILDNLDMTYMGNFGMTKDKWTLNTDIIYMKLGTKPGPILSNIQLKSWIVTPTVSYRLIESGQWDIDLLAGARYLYIAPMISVVNNPIVDTSDSGWDGIVGFKANCDLNEKWFMPFAFDVGAGDSDLTWQAFAGVGYKYENFDVIAGYRYLEWDFDTNKAGLKSLDISGPIIGVKYRF